MKTYSVFLGLGSNVGERHQHLNRAAAELKKLPDSKLIWTSSVYETDPYGNEEQPKFLNAVAELETPLEPPQLLREVKSIEKRLGRTGTERWGPREIDIDVLIYDGLVLQEGEVIVPHPELDKRKFVLVPLREIAPDLVHPVSGMTITELSSACPDQGKVIKTSYRILI